MLQLMRPVEFYKTFVRTFNGFTNILFLWKLRTFNSTFFISTSQIWNQAMFLKCIYFLVSFYFYLTI